MQNNQNAQEMDFKSWSEIQIDMTHNFVWSSRGAFALAMSQTYCWQMWGVLKICEQTVRLDHAM